MNQQDLITTTFKRLKAGGNLAKIVKLLFWGPGHGAEPEVKDLNNPSSAVSTPSVTCCLKGLALSLDF